MDKYKALVIDIECYSDADINTPEYIETAKVKWIGMYSYIKDKYYEVLIAGKPDNKKKVIEFIAQHDTLITFNGNLFDIPILKNNKIIDNKFFHSLDMWQILGNDKMKGCKNRGEYMGYDFRYNSLKDMAEVMKLSIKKGDIDYRIFKKDEYTEEEIKEIKEYLRADIEVTKQMFDICYNFWIPFAELINEKNKRNWSWMKSTLACLVYKAACNLLQIDEVYGEGTNYKGVGARVIEPKVEEAWDLYYVDVNSLYPHIYAMFNLIAENNNREGWHGNDEFEVQGYYDVSKPHKMSLLLMEMFRKRLELKKKDPKNPMVYAYKLFLNIFYGANRNPVFMNIYTENSGEDCCRIGQKINIIMERMLIEKGYDVLAGDTDSNFPKPKIPKTYEDVEKDLKDIADYINSKSPFPQPTFKIAIEHKIDYIMFIKSEKKTLKKNYVYVWTDKKGDKQVEIMGLPIIKSQATGLGKLILDKYIIPKIKQEIKGKFDRDYFLKIIDDELKENIMLIAQEYKCKPYNSYDEKGKKSIWAKISREYLNGKGGYVKLIKNNKVGKIGDEDKYCSIEEAQQANLRIKDIDLTKLYNELSPFIKGGLGENKEKDKSRSLNDFA